MLPFFIPYSLNTLLCDIECVLNVMTFLLKLFVEGAEVSLVNVTTHLHVLGGQVFFSA